MFVDETRAELDRVERVGPHSDRPSQSMNETLQRVALLRREAVAPAERLIEALHPWVAFAIMPLFALANAGVSLSAVSFDRVTLLSGMGIVAGLVLGNSVHRGGR